MPDPLGRPASEPASAAAGAPASAEIPEAPVGSHRIWAALLVLDSAFVIVFGGLVASKVYQYWSAPQAIPGPAAVHRRPPRAAEAPHAAAPAEAPPAPAAPPASPAPKPAPAPEPSVETPKSSAAAASEGHARAAPVEFKFKAPDASSVQIVGAFIVHGGRKEMTRRPDGTWTTKLYLNRGQYRYFYFVDGKRTLDPNNPRSDRGASLLTVP
jgi:hypothetical protein